MNGTWSFAYLGDVIMEPVVPEVSEWQEALVPDAFDMRPDKPRCSECWPASSPSGANDGECQRCCNRAMGHEGNRECWNPFEGNVDNTEFSFTRCCGEDPMRYKRGVAVYKADVQTLPGSAGLLYIYGCGLRCLVAVDGVFLADHAGLSPFHVEVPAAGPEVGKRTVLVLADNRFDARTHPVHHNYYDWYQAGGLIRMVQFHSLADSQLVYLSSVEVYPKSQTRVNVLVQVSAAAEARSGLVYAFTFDDEEEGCQPKPGWGQLQQNVGLVDFEVPGGQPWSPSSPRLHRLKVALLSENGDRILDCVDVRFGLRTVRAEGRNVLVNDEPVKLFGFNRHDFTDRPVLSYGELTRDIAVLQTLGANFVRGSHYAQDQRFLDLCDVHGIYVWEEALGWQNSREDFADGVFIAQSLKLADEMATASANHPSVIFFGFFNEGQSDDESATTRNAYAGMADRLRQRSQGTRLVSWGSSAATEDRHLHLADVIAFHAYPAWYPTTIPADLRQAQQIPLMWEAYSDWVATNFPDKPFIVTEAGAGGLFGHHGPSDQKWTEEYQSLLFQLHYLSVKSNPRIVGISLWQFADIPIDREASSEAARPRGLNNKGVVGVNRQPKTAFHALRLLQQQKPGEYFGLILPEHDAERMDGLLRM